MFVNQLQADNPAEGLDPAAHVIDAVRVITYPLLGWTVVQLVRLHLTTPAKASKWFAPLALIPGAVIWAATNDPWRGLLEVVVMRFGRVDCGRQRIVPGSIASLTLACLLADAEARASTS